MSGGWFNFGELFAREPSSTFSPAFERSATSRAAILSGGVASSSKLSMRRLSDILALTHTSDSGLNMNSGRNIEIKQRPRQLSNN